MSDAPPAATLMNLVMRMLKEGYEGAPGPWTYFTDTSPGTGVLTTIDRLSAAEASRTGGPSGSTIAGHVQHLVSSVQLCCRTLNGEPASRDRSDTWTVSQVDEPAWARLRAELRKQYQGLLVAVGRHANWDEDAIGTAFGAVAHSAYHLGSIRQRLTPGP